MKTKMIMKMKKMMKVKNVMMKKKKMMNKLKKKIKLTITIKLDNLGHQLSQITWKEEIFNKNQSKKNFLRKKVGINKQE